MKMEQLVQRAAQIARAQVSAGSGRRTVIGGSKGRGTASEQYHDGGGDLARRLAAYEEALQAAKDHDPACPDCWVERQEHLAMTPIACETLDEVQFGCMECGFEVSFAARTGRYWARPDRHRKRPRAA